MKKVSFKELEKIAEGIVLFGSRARGDAGPFSDVDLYIVAPDKSVEPGIYRDGKKEMIVRWWSDFKAEFESALPLALEISRDGKILKGSERFRREFERLRKKALGRAVWIKKKGVWKWI